MDIEEELDALFAGMPAQKAEQFKALLWARAGLTPPTPEQRRADPGKWRRAELAVLHLAIHGRKRDDGKKIV